MGVGVRVGDSDFAQTVTRLFSDPQIISDDPCFQNVVNLQENAGYRI